MHLSWLHSVGACLHAPPPRFYLHLCAVFVFSLYVWHSIFCSLFPSFHPSILPSFHPSILPSLSFSFLSFLLLLAFPSYLPSYFIINKYIYIYHIICARTRARARNAAKTRHKNRAAFLPPSACYPKIYLNIKAVAVFFPNVCSVGRVCAARLCIIYILASNAYSHI